MRCFIDGNLDVLQTSLTDSSPQKRAADVDNCPQAFLSAGWPFFQKAAAAYINIMLARGSKMMILGVALR